MKHDEHTNLEEYTNLKKWFSLVVFESDNEKILSQNINENKVKVKLTLVRNYDLVSQSIQFQNPSPFGYKQSNPFHFISDVPAFYSWHCISTTNESTNW